MEVEVALPFSNFQFPVEQNTFIQLQFFIISYILQYCWWLALTRDRLNYQTNFPFPASPPNLRTPDTLNSIHTHNTTQPRSFADQLGCCFFLSLSPMVMASLIQFSPTPLSSVPITTRFTRTHKSRLRCSLDANVSDMSVNGL